jgi:hypothetical protein
LKVRRGEKPFESSYTINTTRSLELGTEINPAKYCPNVMDNDLFDPQNSSFSLCSFKIWPFSLVEEINKTF